MFMISIQYGFHHSDCLPFLGCLNRLHPGTWRQVMVASRGNRARRRTIGVALSGV